MTYPSVSYWSGVAKQRYGKFINPLPEDNSISEIAPFVPANQQGGDQFNFPVMLTLEGGVTHDKSNTAFTVGSAVDSTSANAMLDAPTILMTATIPFDILSKFGKPGATVGDYRAMDLKIKMLLQSSQLYRELSMLYGPGTGTALSNIGVVSASISGANLAAPQVINVTKATWAPGIWNQMVGQYIDVYQSDGSTLRAADVTVTAVTDRTKNRLKLTKSGSSATVAAGDLLIQRGACTNGCYGLQAQLENTGSLFNIDASIYPIWRAVNYSAGSAALTTAKIREMASQLWPNGLTAGGDLFVSGPCFADLAAELTALQRYTENTSATKRTGADAIEIMSPIGTIYVKVHRFMKQGIAMFLPRGGEVVRIGSSDIAMSLDGTGGDLIVKSTTVAGYQVQTYQQQSPLLTVPYHAAEITSIVSTADTAPS